MIELLVTAKYLKRTINKDDRRKSNLVITEFGHETITLTSVVVEKYRNSALKGIGIAKEDHVKTVMKTIINNCQ
jgi:DNA-binding MarR family transcriptional regulator